MLNSCMKIIPHSNASVQVIFYKTIQKTTKEQILKLLSVNSKFTREDLAQSIGISTNAIKQHLSDLQTKNKLQRIGSTRSGYWKVLDE